MNDVSELSERLRPIVGKIERWRADSQRIGTMMEQARRDNGADAAALEAIEETAGAIFREIEEFRLLLGEIEASSPKAAGELAAVNDSLHLVLMEITEFSTQMYSFRQGE
ncbi:MAG: hypothetical protein WD942_04025, partial [Dehalococcoidia bacterium]